MCIKPSVVQEVETNPSDCIKSLVAEPTNHHRIKTMPKKYHPYQVTDSKRKERGPKVVCKNVGSNGTIFIVQDDDDNSNLSATAGSNTWTTSDVIDKTVKQEEEDVDVERVEVIGDQDPLSSTPFVLSAKVQEVNNKTLKEELFKNPAEVDQRPKNNNGNQGLKQELLESPTSYRRSSGSFQTKPPQPAGKSPNNPAGTVAFVAILLHALKCSNCEKPACRKMIMVLKHYKLCAFKRNSSLTSGQGWSASVQNCKICGQLLRIVAQHAKSDCKIPANQMGCPVLMCDTFRRANAVAAAKQMNSAGGNSPELKTISDAAITSATTRMPAARRMNRMTQQPV